MKEDTGDKSMDTPDAKSRETGFKVAIVIISLVAFMGVGLSAYGLINNSKKDEQIADLQAKIRQLESKLKEPISYQPTTISEKTKIKVISSSWSGWSADYKPVKKESFCEIKLREKCVVKTVDVSNTDGEEWVEEVLSFEVTSIGNDSINIHTYQPFSDRESGIDLYSNKQDFVIKIGESIELTTPTMDEGDIFTLSLFEEEQ